MNLQKQELPNSTLILIMGILSIVGCCCYGAVGLIFGIVAIILSKKSIEIYQSNPELYLGYQNVKTGRILGIIGIVLSAIVVLSWLVALIFFGGMEGIYHMQDEVIRQYGG
ncbi:CCC motif membrane protein [Gillisia sp. Hel_I_29]|uniref:CCC motif membrane protein n=1 Tax=Gillisia sp. Hel_I_29 TaxID=1249975 RepID=UPI0005568D9F|nr:CCC motif membrane protein [Gillisia sp. Hel_I_29]